MKLPQIRDAYKQFFTSEAGKLFLETGERFVESNIRRAQDTNSLDYLSRSKGNKEILDLIANVLNTEVTPKE